MTLSIQYYEFMLRQMLVFVEILRDTQKSKGRINGGDVTSEGSEREGERERERVGARLN